MEHANRRRGDRPARHVASLLLSAVVLFPAWAFGGTEGWAIRVLAAGALCASVAVCFARRSRDGKALWQEWDWRWGAPLLALALLVAVQALNPSHVYSVADQGLTPLKHVAWLPHSASAPDTLNALLLLFASAAVFWCMRSVAGSVGLAVVVGSIITGATAMAMLSLTQGSDRAPGELVGCFLNENSFAAYINLAFPLALGSARALQQHAAKLGRRSNPGPLFYFLAGVMAVSVLQCGSRAGAIVCALQFLTWVLLEWRASRRHAGGRFPVWLGPVIPVLPVVGLLALLGVESLVREGATLGSRLGLDLSLRFSVWRGTWQLFIDHPLYGVGAGTFHATFPYYQDVALGGFYRHAHNDWLQWLAELGLIGSTLGVAAVVMAFQRRRAIHDLAPPMVSAMMLSLVGVALHAVVDLPFRIPAIAVVVAVCLGALGRRRVSDGGD